MNDRAGQQTGNSRLIRLLGQGTTYGEPGNHQKSLEAFERAIELMSPLRQPIAANAGRSLPWAAPHKTKDQWEQEGDAHAQAKRYEEALVAFEQAIRCNPQDGKDWCNKGDVLKELRRAAEAEQAYKKARELGYHW